MLARRLSTVLWSATACHSWTSCRSSSPQPEGAAPAAGVGPGVELGNVTAGVNRRDGRRGHLAEAGAQLAQQRLAPRIDRFLPVALPATLPVASGLHFLGNRSLHGPYLLSARVRLHRRLDGL